MAEPHTGLAPYPSHTGSLTVDLAILIKLNSPTTMTRLMSLEQRERHVH